MLPMAGALMFAIFVGLGVLQRNNAQAHKRLMLLATISILDAAIARMPGMFEAGPLAFFAVADAFILAGVVYDLATRGRVHRGVDLRRHRHRRLAGAAAGDLGHRALGELRAVPGRVGLNQAIGRSVVVAVKATRTV